MKHLANRLTLLLILLPIIVFSQNKNYKMKWGKVSKEDLAMTSYDPAPTAAAVVLGETGHIDFIFSGEDPTIYFNTHVRIKILSEAGLDWAKINLDFYSKGDFENIVNIAGQTIAPDGTVSKLPKKEIIKVKRNEFWSEVKFTLPNVKVGSVIEYKYKKEIRSVHLPPFWYFQSSIPKRWSKLEMERPDFLHYSILKEYTTGLKEEEILKSRTYEFIGFKQYINGRVVEIEKYNRYATVHYESYIMDNIPSFDTDNLVSYPKDHYSKLYFQLNATEFQDNQLIPVFDSWKDHTIERYEDSRLGKQITNKRNFNKIVEAIMPQMSSAKTDEDKIKIIANFISSEVEWNGYYSIYSRKSLNASFQEGTSNSSEMNLMGIALLNHFGIKSHPVLVSTKGHGKVITAYPISNQFNHIIIQIAAEELILLDFSKKSLPLGTIRPEAINGKGLAIHEGGAYNWIDVTSPITSETSIMNFSLDEKGKLSGKLQIILDNYKAMYFRQEYENKGNDKEYAINFISNEFSQVKINYLEAKDLNNKSAKFINGIELEIPNFAKESKDIISVPVFLNNSWDWIGKSIEKEKRNYPLTLPYPFKDKIIFNMKIPSGYTIEKMPENSKFSLPDNSASFSYRSSVKENNIQVIISLSLKKYNFPEKEYADFKHFFKLVLDKTQKLITLKKL